MTVNQVKESVVAYGFSFDLADNDRLFYTSLNSAIRKINRLRPRTGSITIVHEPPSAVAKWTEMSEYTPGGTLTFTAVARSVVFEVTGSGGVTVSGAVIGDDAAATWSLEHGWVRYVATSPGLHQISLSFTGQYPFFVRNVAFYTDTFAPSHEYSGGATVDYDLSKITPDFGAAILPIMRDGAVYTPDNPRFLLVRGNTLRIPQEARGTYEISYERAVPTIPFSHDEVDATLIPLDDELAALLPLLIASFVWLEDSPDTAERYAMRYREEAAEIRKTPAITHYIDRKRWT